MQISKHRYRLPVWLIDNFQATPPNPEYRLVGWHCVYHEQQGRTCHNPLDCDLVPMWALTVEAALKAFNKR